MMSPRLPRTLISHARRARGLRVPTAVLACAVVVATAATPMASAARGGDSAAAADRSASRAWSPFLGEDRPVDAVDARRVIVRFDDPSLGEWVATEQAGPGARAAWMKRAAKLQQRRIDSLASAGVRFRIEHRYLRVLNGVSLVVQGDGAQLLRAVDGVAAVTPVRTIWPTALKGSDDGVGAAAVIGADAHQARGDDAHDPIRVAVLDSGVDATHGAVAGRVLRALDATTDSTSASVHADAHGTAVAGAVIGGADGHADVRVLPIQVLEQRPALDGVEALLGDSDDLLAGLERAVDPDERIRTNDGAPIAVVASTSPYAGFAGSPEDLAVQGASALGTMVVAAAGNDGASGDDVGTVGSVAASTSALTVGAADLRDTVSAASVRVRGDGIDQTFDAAPLLTAGDEVLPKGASAVVVVEARGDEVEDYLDAQLRSRVRGAVALIATRDGVSAARQVRAAADAGALAVLIGADTASVAAGTIAASGADIPAIGLDRSDARALRDALKDGRVLTVSMQSQRIDNPSFGSVAGFSSAGPRLDGTGRPDVLGPGVGMVVAGEHGAWHRASGTSIAAAWVAGQAAAVRAAHPDLAPDELRALLIGSAITLGSKGDRPGVALQGAGVLDARRSMAADHLVDGGRIDFGSVAAGSTASHKLALHGLDGDRERIDGVQLDDGGRSLHGAGLSLREGQLELSVPKDAKDGHVGGWLVLADAHVVVPWTATIRSVDEQVVPMRLELPHRIVRRTAGPSTIAGVAQLKIGGAGGSGLGLTAVERLEIQLVDASGKAHGVLGGLDQALPGIYSFGITGVAANGKALHPGAWTLRVRYVPATDPSGAWREGPEAGFTIAAPRPARRARPRT